MEGRGKRGKGERKKERKKKEKRKKKRYKLPSQYCLPRSPQEGEG
jgi:hypothetical protein